MVLSKKPTDSDLKAAALNCLAFAVFYLVGYKIIQLAYYRLAGLQWDWSFALSPQPEDYFFLLLAMIFGILTRDHQRRISQNQGLARATLALVFFFLYLSTRTDLNTILSYGVDINESEFLNIDANRFLASSIFGERFYLHSEHRFTGLQKEIHVKYEPTGAVGFISRSVAGDSSDDARVSMEVNGVRHSIARLFRQHPGETDVVRPLRVMEFEISQGELRRGKNILRLIVQGNDSGDGRYEIPDWGNYAQGNTYHYDAASGRYREWGGEALCYVKVRPPTWHKIVYRGGLFFLVISVLFLMSAVFHLASPRQFWEKLQVSIALAFIYVKLIVLSIDLWSSWGAVVAKVIYRLFLLVGFDSAYHKINATTWQFTINSMTADVNELCSGIEGLALFSLLYVLIVAARFNEIRKLRAVAFFVIGALGMLMTNTLRIFLLLLIAAVTYPSRSAVTLFHSNLGWILFLCYFLAFITLTERWLYHPPSGGQTRYHLP